ncbi:hypothetical protein [uncultured Mediterranea sp.]|uniref:hypothetical protein n=1 Tax=uncultured Mediterranea sp. TaxID=1926662 RepID=UPI0027D9BA0D|nr:hypothetical protein [uncultured Mediterranea sp.]
MKTITLYTLVIVFFLTACQSSIIEPEEVLPVKKEILTSPTTWQEQIEFAQQYKTKTKSNMNDLSFIGYRSLGEIKTEEQISAFWNKLFADDTNVVTYVDEYMNKFEILPISRLKLNKSESYIQNIKKHLKSQLDTIVKVGTKLIEFEWNYKGKQIFSIGIIHNDKIIYDHIGSMIIIPETRPQAPQIISIPPKIKTRSEEAALTERYFSISNDGGTNIFGGEVWSYNIYCSSIFDWNGVFHDCAMYAKHYANFGWSCDAKIQTVDGKIGETKFHQFAWGHAHAYLFSASVSIAGVDVHYSPSENGGSGVLTHRK